MFTSKCLALAFLFLLFGASSPLLSQESSDQAPSPTSQAQTDRASFELQLSVIVTSSDPTTKGTMPQTLEPVIKQLRQSLPYANYRVVATYNNRGKSGSNVESSGMLACDTILSASISGFPCFYEYNLVPVRLTADGVEIPRARFGFRVPTPVGGSLGSTPIPVNYQSTGIATELSLREATPTLVGTMTTNKPDQILVIVLSVKRTQ